jgi:DNA-binding transcriptional regulator YiaG
MARTLEQMLAERPVRREHVESHKQRMRDEISAHRLRELREASELTQIELAALLHVSQNRVSRIEHGDIERTQVDTLRRYVEAIGGRLHLEVDMGDQRIQLV